MDDTRPNRRLQVALVYLYMKHDDRASLKLEGTEMDSGYLPYVNDVLGGDDTSLRIDNDTGKILGWTPVKIKDGKFVEEES